jgi:hypothetical protein
VKFFFQRETIAPKFFRKNTSTMRKIGIERNRSRVRSDLYPRRSEPIGKKFASARNKTIEKIKTYFFKGNIFISGNKVKRKGDEL